MTVERDDLAGDEDQIELALHMSRVEKRKRCPSFWASSFR